MSGRALVGFLGLVATTVSWAVPGFWEMHGPYGGSVLKLIADQNAPNRIYAAGGLNNGIFKSTNDGLNWARFAQNIYPSPPTLEMDQDGSGALYVFNRVTSELMRSSDAGTNWSPAGYVFPPSLGAVDSAFLRDVPGATNQLYLSPTDVGGLYFSNDGGNTFNPVTSPSFVAGVSSAPRFRVVAIDPSSPNIRLAGIVEDSSSMASLPSLYRSIDGGMTWSAVYTDSSHAPDFPEVNAISFGVGSRVYALVNHELLFSDDDGATWTASTFVADSDVYAPLMAHPTQAEIVYVGDASGFTKVTFLASPAGAYSTTNLNSGLSPNPSFTGLVSKVTALAIHPSFSSNNLIYIGTYSDGFFRSTDGGNNWSNHSDSLSPIRISTVATYPQAAFTGATAKIYAGLDPLDGYPTAGVFLSNDGGGSWGSANNGLRAFGVLSLAIDPTTSAMPTSAHVFAGGIAAAPTAPYSDAFRNGGLYKSLDGGSSWSTIDQGLPYNMGGTARDIGLVKQIAFDPRSCAMPPVSGACVTGPLQTVYAIAVGRRLAGRVDPMTVEHRYRVVKSTDAGTNWVEVEAVMGRLPDLYDPGSGTLSETVVPNSLVVDPQTTQTLYVGTSHSGVGTSTIHNGVFKSIDGGATWTPVNSGLPRVTGSTNTVLDVYGIAINPYSPGTLWASVIADSATGRIFKTTDGGMSWTRADTGINTYINKLVADPSDLTGNTVYAISFVNDPSSALSDPGGVYKTTDGGTTWRSISVGLGFEYNEFNGLAIDPGNPAILHIATRKGVWSLTQPTDTDRDGVADSVEDTVPNDGDGNLDSIRDRYQPDVGSGVVLSTTPPIEPTASGCGNSFTAEVTSATCSVPGTVQSVDVQGVLQEDFGGSDFFSPAISSANEFGYPLDLVRFEIQNCSQAEVEITFHNAGGNTNSCPDFNDQYWNFRFYGPSTPGVDSTIGWYSMQSPPSGSARATVVGPRTWRVTLDANQFGSYRPVGNSILFMGGPALYPERIFRDSME